MSAWLLIPAFIVGAWVGFALMALMVASSRDTPPDLDEGVPLHGNPVSRIDSWVRR
jgi:hypothetical protein